MKMFRFQLKNHSPYQELGRFQTTREKTINRGQHQDGQDGRGFRIIKDFKAAVGQKMLQ